MTDDEVKAEEFVKEEVCKKCCPIFSLGEFICDTSKCHYTSSLYKGYLIGLKDGRKESIWQGLRFEV